MYPLVSVTPLGLEIASRSLVLILITALLVLLGPAAIERCEGYDRRLVRRALAWMILAAFAGARLQSVIGHPGYYLQSPLLLFLPWGGGLHLAGAFVGAILVGAPAVAHWYGWSVAKLADAMMPLAAASFAFGRVGCLLNGCCYGLRCTYPWCLALYPKGTHPFTMQVQEGALPATASITLPMHPTPFYFMAGALLAGAVALWLYRHKRYDGQVALVTSVILFWSTAAAEMFRDPTDHTHWGSMTQLAWSAIGLAVAATMGWIGAEIHHYRSTADRTDSPVATEPTIT